MCEGVGRARVAAEMMEDGERSRLIELEDRPAGASAATAGSLCSVEAPVACLDESSVRCPVDAGKAMKRRRRSPRIESEDEAVSFVRRRRSLARGGAAV